MVFTFPTEIFAVRAVTEFWNCSPQRQEVTQKEERGREVTGEMRRVSTGKYL